LGDDRGVIMATRIEDIWVAAYGAAFANQVETAFLSYHQSVSGKTRAEVADLHRQTFAEQAREIAALAVKGLAELQEAEEDDSEEDST
jgi:hypothetical protein